MTLSDEILEIEEDKEISKLEKQLTRTRLTSEDRRKEIERLKRSELILGEENTRLKSALNIASSSSEFKLQVPKWQTQKKKKQIHRATPMLLLSDLHLDEVVQPEE